MKQRLVRIFFKNCSYITLCYEIPFSGITKTKKQNLCQPPAFPGSRHKKLKLLKCWNLKFILIWLNHLIHYVQYEQYFTACSSSFWNPAFSSFEINHNIMHPKLRYTYEIIILRIGSKGCMFYIVLSTVFHFMSSKGWGRWTPCSTYPFSFLILVK